MAGHYVAQTTARVRHPKPARRGVRSGLSRRRPHDRPGGPKQHVRDRYITLFIVQAVSEFVGARLGVGDNLMHIWYATDNVQDASLAPSFENSIEVTNFGLCLNGSNPGAEPYVPDFGFNPAYTPPLPPPDDFALDDVIGDQTTLGAVAYSSDPARA